MKYIDADKLIERLEEMKQAEYENCGGVNSKTGALYGVQELITSLQQEKRVDLEKAFAHEYAIYQLPNFIIASIVDGTELIDFIYKTARHFYELGLNARKEE